MSRARHLTFAAMGVVGLLLAVLAAAIQTAVLMPAFPVPVLGDMLSGRAESELWLWLIGALGGVVLLFLVGWILSLDPERPRRPYGWLYLLGLSTSIPLGVGVWLTIELQNTLKRSEAAIVGVLVALLAPLLLIAVEALIGSCFAALAGLAQKWRLLGLASFLTRQYQRFRPNHPDLNRRIGLLDFERGRRELASPRLMAQLDEGRADQAVVDALWDIHRRDRDSELVLRLGNELIERGGGRHAKGSVHRAVGEILAGRQKYDDAIPHFEASIDRENPSDLSELGRLYAEAGRWDDLAPLLLSLEELEGPPRQRCTTLYRHAVRLKEAHLLPMLRQYADFLDRFRMGEERMRVLEIMLEIDPDDTETRGHLIDYYRKESVDLKLVEHLMELRARGDDSDDLAAEVIELLAKVRRLDEAAELAEACAGRWSDQFRFHFLQASIAFSREQLDEADEVARRAKEIASEEEAEKVRPLLRKIQSALDDRELSLLEQRVKDEPQAVEPRIDFLRRLVRKGRLERAVVEADQFMRTIPAERDTLKAELRALVGEDGKPFLLAEFLAEQHLTDGDWDAVHDLYGAMAKSSFSPSQTLRTGAERILAADDLHAPSHLRLYEVILEGGDPATASSHARRYLELGGTLDFDQRAGLFAAYCTIEDLEHGEPLGLELIEEQPYAVQRICALSQLYIANHKFPEALDWLNRAKRVEPGNSAIYHLIEVARKKQRERRSLALRELIDKNPEDAGLLNELADLMVEFKRYDDALRYYQRAAQATEEETQRLVCMTRLAWCMAKRSMFDTAIETLSEVPMKVTDDKKGLADRKRVVYEIAEILEDHNHFDDAVRLYKEVFKVDAGFRHVMEKVTRLAK